MRRGSKCSEGGAQCSVGGAQNAVIFETSDAIDEHAGFHTGFFARGGKHFWKSKCPCRGAWGYSGQGSVSLDTSC